MMQRSLLSSLIIQLCLAVLAVAAPIAEETLTTTKHSHLGFGAGGGVLGLVVFILDIIVIVEVLKSNRPPASKLVWCLVVFLFPIIGLVIYWLFSDRAAHRSGSSYEPLA